MRGTRSIRAIVTLTLALAATSSARAQATLEYQVKAAFLTKFTAFVSWPAGAISPGEPLKICTVGTDPFGALLDNAAHAQVSNGHTVSVMRLAAPDRSAGCNVVYISGPPSAVSRTLMATRGEPMLTVTDGNVAGSPHGIVHFVRFGDRVRFLVDTRQAAEAGLALSSKLLAVAMAVKK